MGTIVGNFQASDISRMEIQRSVCMEMEQQARLSSWTMSILAMVFLWKWFPCCCCPQPVGLRWTPEAGLLEFGYGCTTAIVWKPYLRWNRYEGWEGLHECLRVSISISQTTVPRNHNIPEDFWKLQPAQHLDYLSIQHLFIFCLNTCHRPPHPLSM